jgi:hypothetical protein
MKRMGPGGSGEVAGDGWFKIWHDGFRDGAFCTERLRRNGNKMDFSIPSDLAGYLPFLYFDIQKLTEEVDTTLSVRSPWPYIRVESPEVLSGTLGIFSQPQVRCVCLTAKGVLNYSCTRPVEVHSLRTLSQSLDMSTPTTKVFCSTIG